MASHSRPYHPRITVTRAAVTLALASATSISFFGESAGAQPQLTPDEVKAEVATLYRQVEQATENYDGAQAQAQQAQTAVNDVQDQLARQTARFNAARGELGAIAAAQYRSGSLDPALRLLLSGSPQAYLEQAGLLDQMGRQQSQVLSRLADRRREMAQTRAEAQARLGELRAAQRRLADRKQTVQHELAQAQALLAQLSPPDRAAVQASDVMPGSNGDTAANRSATRPPLGGATTPFTSPALPGSASGAPSARAAQAVAYAYRALGRPYVWGATGPGAFDCSGLTQAAWRAAGVSLPRTTYTQINAGTRVSQSQLRPGDLVFFYAGISHVGIYIGGGQMIHAPHPGAPVRIAPISEMPFAGATRPA